MSGVENVVEVARHLRSGDRRVLARAITTAESTRAEDREHSAALMDEVIASTGSSYRVGVSGAPGAGKSTFIEALGMHLVSVGLSVAVLAVDPSSARTGGSILGDKTRMEELARCPQAFIRPSPSGGTLGGVARRTREALLLCEAAGFDVVLVETVGVGQSEVAVAAMVDTFVLLLAPAAGDELQGVKRGIMELADIIVVNKNDGDLAASATRTAADYANAAHFLRPRTAHWETKVLLCSALLNQGVDEIWATIMAHREALAVDDQLQRLRADQASEWMYSEISESLLDSLKADTKLDGLLARLDADVRSGLVSPAAGALDVLRAFRALPPGQPSAS